MAAPAPLIMQGPLFLGWLSSAEAGPCDTCKPDPADGEQAIGVARFRFGEVVIQMCGTCLRRLKNQIRRAEG